MGAAICHHPILPGVVHRQGVEEGEKLVLFPCLEKMVSAICQMSGAERASFESTRKMAVSALQDKLVEPNLRLGLTAWKYSELPFIRLREGL